MKKEIAVLMPAYNPGLEISETLDSLHRQSAPFKLFVIDDGSRNVPDYKFLLRDFDYHLIISPKNLGVNEARNPALRQILTEGFQYIALIDCGDVAMPQRLAKQKAFLDSNPDVSILGSCIEMVFTETRKEFSITYPSGSGQCRVAMWSNMPVSHPALMIRSQVFEQIGLYSKRYEAAEDYDFIRRAAAAGFGIDNMQDILLRKIETLNSISRKKRGTQLNSRLAIQWEHRDLTNLQCLVGLLKTTLIRITPDAVTHKIKQTLGKI